jgi:hypothetical protein
MVYSFQIIEILATDRFKREYKKLSPDIQSHVDSALADLLKNPIPKSRRFEKLKGFHNPCIYTIHATPNHSHKISFELKGSRATLRHISTHKLIDREP